MNPERLRRVSEGLRLRVTEVASRLPLPVDLEALMTHLGIRFQVRRVGATHKGAKASLSTDLEGRFTISILRSCGWSGTLTPHDRFSVAHEIAHVMIEVWTAWRPVSRGDYHKREELANDLAARLLVPDHTFASEFPESPTEVLRLIARVRDRCDVSWAVAGRRIGEGRAGAMFAEARAIRNANNERVLRVTWVAGDTSLEAVRPGKHLGPDHRWWALADSLSGSERSSWHRPAGGTVEWSVVSSRRHRDRYFLWKATRASPQLSAAARPLAH